MRPIFAKTVIMMVVSLLAGNLVNAEEIRDYYSEPGLHPFKNPTSDLNETIDPFSGTMQLRHTDISVPGNGGMDISVSRYYTSHQDFGDRQPSYQSLYGIGWTLNFGRIVVPQAHADKICLQATFSVTTADNPSLEHPDGAREILVLATDGTGDLITKSNWRARCAPDDGLIVTAPDGTVFNMNIRATVAVGAGSLEVSWHPSQRVDLNGNAIQINYLQHALGYLYFDEVVGGLIDESEVFIGDGRLVKFAYGEDQNNGCFLLDTITTNSQVWTYEYGPALANETAGFDLCRYNLTSVTLPSGQQWQYEYHPDTHPGAGKFSLSKVTYPYGGTVDYSYQHVQFNQLVANETTSIHTKTISGPDIAPGTWTYLFAPESVDVSGGAGTAFADQTQVTRPDGIDIYLHQGAGLTGLGNVWAAGLVLTKQVVALDFTLIEQTTTVWDKRIISNENYFHGVASEIDNETYSPIQLQVDTYRNGGTHSTFMSDYDQYGNPGTITENSLVIGEPDKVTNITYFSNPANWVIGLKEDETLVDIGTIDRSFNPIGQLISEDRYGVATSFTYTSEGDLETTTDARNNTVTKSDYFRGIPRLEDHPESVSISRVVNNTGTVASITNGRGFVKSFSYDQLNRLVGIDFPLNADVTVDWTATGKALTRSNYEETVTFDGFGKEVSIERKDTVSNEVISKTTRFDALGQKVFESYPNSLLGVNFTYDVLGRLTRLDHPDGAFKSYEFGTGGVVVTETDERNNQTQFLYRAYGHPDSGKVPLVINSPEGTCTNLQYNLLNQNTRVFQGTLDTDGLCFGFSRDYLYDSRYFLELENHDETGITTFGRDAIGNMVSRKVGSSGTTIFVYDDLNRLVMTDYPGTTPDVTRSYDANNNIISVSNADSVHSYDYDDNDNLSTETIDIGSSQYLIDYTYDSNDIVNTLTYPTGRAVNYAADAFGRPSQVAPYVTSIDYYPSGQIQQFVYANGQTTEIALNDRLWVERIHTSGNTEATDLTYQYDPIGNIESIVDAVDPFNSRTLTYDNMNRLFTADGSWGTGAFSYSGRGDLLTMDIGSATMDYDYSSQRLSNVLHGSGVRNVYGYDVYGNVQNDTILDVFGQPLVVNTYSYDDAGNLRTAVKSQGGADLTHSYGYDGDGKRVTKSTPDKDIDYVYAVNGNLLGEYEPAAGTQFGKENFYLGFQLVVNLQENQLPIANAGADAIVLTGSAEQLSGAASFDPDGDIASYSWQQTAGTVVTLATPASAVTSYVAPQVSSDELLSFQLTVTDNDGESSSDTVDITVRANTLPVVAIDEPINGGIFPSSGVVLSAVSTDAEDGDISSLTVWTSDLDGEFATDDQVTTSLSPGSHQITASVIDSLGGVATDTVTISVLAATIPSWNFATAGQIDSSAAVAADGTIYIGSDDGNLYALNPDGTQKWVFATGNIINTVPAIASDGTLRITAGDTLFALDAGGDQLWSFETTREFTSPAVNESGKTFLYDGFWSYGIDPDGSQDWRVQTNFLTNNDTNGSPIIGADGAVYIATDSNANDGDDEGTLYKLDPDTGVRDWVAQLHGRVSSSPAIAADGTIYVPTYATRMYAINPDGTVKWQFFFSSGFSLGVKASVSLGADGTIYVGTENDNFYAINPVDGTEIWHYAAESNVHSTAAVAADGTIYFGSQGNSFHAVNPDGTLKWFADIGIDESSTTILDDGTVLIGGEDGNLYAFNESNGGPAASSWPMFRHDSRGTGDVLFGGSDLPPVVAITGPADDATFNLGDATTFTGTATDLDDGDLGNAIDWSSSIDGALGTGATVGPITLSEGSHTITASVIDSAANSDSATINLNVIQPVNTPPTINISSPADGAVFTEADLITLIGTGSDTEDGDISGSIQWSSDLDGLLGSGATIGATLSVGSHLVTASVTDSGSLSATQSITLVVNEAPNTPPVIAITSPADGGSFEQGSAVTFVGSANDTEDGDLSSVIQWSSDQDGSLGSGVSVLSTLTLGSHVITASVTDSDSATSTVTISLVITAPVNTPPTINISSPADGAVFQVGVNVAFTAAANDAEDGDISSAISWSSDIDGSFGSGATLQAQLSIGMHQITATIIDSDAAQTTATVDIDVLAVVNLPPVLTLTAPQDGTVHTINDIIQFSALASDVEDGDISSAITWSSDIDGLLGSGADINSLLTIGMHQISAAVTDSGALTASQTVTVTVTPLGNTPPQLTVTSPVDGSQITEGELLALLATADDTEDGDISSAIIWSSDIDGPLGNGASVNVILTAGSHQISASITDSAAVTITQSRTVTVNPDSGVITDVVLTTTPASPQIDGTQVTLTGQASGGDGPYEYKFRYKGPATGFTWQVLQDWSSTSSVVWDSTADRGKNKLQVKARTQGTNQVVVKQKVTYKIESLAPATEVILTSSDPGPVTAGTVITLTGQGSGGDGVYDYKFQVKGPATGDVWQLLQNWSATSSATWDTTSYPGSHKLRVKARNSGSVDSPVKDKLTITVNN